MATPKQIAQDLERWDNGDGTNSVRVVNKDGSVISAGGGGGTSSADEGGFTAGTSTFTPSGGVFNDGLAGVTSGLAAWFRITAFRALHINLRDSSGNEVPTVTAQPGTGTRGLAVWVGNPGSGSSGGTSSADQAAFTAGTTTGTGAMGVFNDALAALTSGTAGWLRATASRALHVNLRNNTGTEIGTATTPVRTDPTGTTTQPVSGTFWQATQPTSATIATDSVGLAKDATLTGGTAKAIPHTPAKGTTAAGDVTSANVDANTQALHVQLAGTQPSVPVTGTFWQATQPVSGTFWQATQPVSGTFFQATQPVSETDGSNVAIGATTDAAVTTNATGTLSAKLRGLVAILADVWDSTNHWLKVSQQASASGGATSFSTMNAATAVINSNVKSSGGNIYQVTVTNASGGCYLRLYDKATAPATTDTPIFRVQVPVNATAANGAGIVVPIDVGLTCTLGIGIRVTGAAADNDATTFATVNTVIANVVYK